LWGSIAGAQVERARIGVLGGSRRVKVFGGRERFEARSARPGLCRKQF
jgi:hypothetical protein